MTDHYEDQTNPKVPDVFRPELAPEDRPAAKKARGAFWMAVAGVVVLLILFSVFGYSYWNTQEKIRTANEEFKAQEQALQQQIAKVERWKDFDLELRELTSAARAPRPSLPPLSEEDRARMSPEQRAERARLEQDLLSAQRNYDAAANVDGWLGEKNVELQVYVRAIKRDEALLGPDVPKDRWQKDEAAVLYRGFDAYRASLKPPTPRPPTAGTTRKTGEVN